MFENMINFFKKIGKKDRAEESSKNMAKERLHLVLMQDRANVSADFLDMMRQEIIEVIKKYIDVDEKDIDVRLTNKTNEDGTTGAPALYANIPIAGIKKEKVIEETKEEKLKNVEKVEAQEEKHKPKSETKKENKKVEEVEKEEDKEKSETKEEKKVQVIKKEEEKEKEIVEEKVDKTENNEETVEVVIDDTSKDNKEEIVSDNDTNKETDKKQKSTKK